MMEKVKVILLGKEYLIGEPNCSQFLEIESLKMTLSGKNYGQMVLSPLKSTRFALDIIDAISTFMVMVPEFREYINKHYGKSILEITPSEVKPIIKAYKEKYYPLLETLEKDWYDEIDTSVTNEEKEEIKND